MMHKLTHLAIAVYDERTGGWMADVVVKGFDNEPDARAWVEEFNRIGALIFEDVVFQPNKLT